MRVGFLHSLIRKEEKLLLEELKRHPEAEVVMLDDRRLIWYRCSDTAAVRSGS